MRNRIVVGLFLLVVCSFPTLADDTPPYDFRNTIWGMSRSEVILSEDQLPIYDQFRGGEGVLRYGRWTDGEPLLDHLSANGIRNVIMEVEYNFDEDLLVAAEVQLQYVLIRQDPEAYAEFFTQISVWLESQYGEGEYVELWKGEPQEGNQITYIYLGELTRMTIWTTDRTAILLTQEPDEQHGATYIRTGIVYVDRA